MIPSGDIYLSEQGAFVSPDDRLLRLFGQADATKGIRIVKDVLRVGRWKVGTDKEGKPVTFNFTAPILKLLCEQFAKAKSRGFFFNVCKTHGDRKTREVHPDDLIAPIDDVKFDGNTVWMSSYVTPEDQIYLSNPARKVSAGIAANWADGEGERYPLQLVHVAVCDNPIVPGQGSFFVLSNNEESTMDFAALVEAINGVLAKANMGRLPDSVDENSLIVALQTLAGGDSETNETESEGIDMSNATNTLNAEVMEALKALSGDVARLSNEVTAFKLGEKKREYVAKLEALASSGKITAAVVNSFKLMGESCQWELSNLSGLDLAESVTPPASVAGKLATGEAPEVKGVHKRLSDEEVQKLSKLVTNAV